MIPGLFTSKTNEWETPQDLFEQLNNEFHFTLDPCATEHNRKCKYYYDKDKNGLVYSWENHSVFMNPPYGKEIYKWVQKAYVSSKFDNSVVVCLLPARTDTKWFHNFCVKGRIYFLKGRLKFGGQKNSAPFPSMIVVFDKYPKKRSKHDNH